MRGQREREESICTAARSAQISHRPPNLSWCFVKTCSHLHTTSLWRHRRTLAPIGGTLAAAYWERAKILEELQQHPTNPVIWWVSLWLCSSTISHQSTHMNYRWHGTQNTYEQSFVKKEPVEDKMNWVEQDAWEERVQESWSQTLQAYTLRNWSLVLKRLFLG